MSERVHDVAIVGAGFTGLSAVAALAARGIDVVVLEARDRVGGRVESQVNGLGERVDTGGQFVCDDMPNVMALLREHGHALVDPDFTGADTAVPPVPPDAVDAISAGAMAIRDRALDIAPSDPAIAGLSVAAWLAAQPDEPAARAAFRSMIEGLWCLSLDDLPLWHLIDNDRRITNEQYELQHCPDRTLHALADDLATRLASAIRLGTPVRSIATERDFLDVETASGVVRARRVLVAMPPSMAARLIYRPGLPPSLKRALAVWRSGAVIKMAIRYETAFWKHDGRSGTVLWREPPGLFACSTGRPGKPTLSAFVAGPLALAWRARGMDAVRDDMLARLATALGPQAATPLDVAIRDWCGDAWSGGAYSDLIVDPTAFDAEDVIRAGAPPLHFACSEVSPSFPGYVEGAIVAGRAAAATMLAATAEGSD